MSNLKNSVSTLQNSVDSLTRSVTELRAELAKLLPLDGSKSMTGDLSMNGNTIRQIRVDEDDMFSAAVIGIIPQPKPDPFDYKALGALYYFDIANCLKDLQLETQKATPSLRCNDPNLPFTFLDGSDIVSIVKEESLTTTCKRLLQIDTLL